MKQFIADTVQYQSDYHVFIQSLDIIGYDYNPNNNRLWWAQPLIIPLMLCEEIKRDMLSRNPTLEVGPIVKVDL